jgi:hypothetical protein
MIAVYEWKIGSNVEAESHTLNDRKPRARVKHYTSATKSVPLCMSDITLFEVSMHDCYNRCHDLFAWCITHI